MYSPTISSPSRILASFLCLFILTGCPEPEETDNNATTEDMSQTTPDANNQTAGGNMGQAPDDMDERADMGAPDMTSPDADMGESTPDMDTDQGMACETDGCMTTCASEDADGDGITDTCDVCDGSDDTMDADNDGVPDDCDVCEMADDAVADVDGDDVCAPDDNCPDDSNPDQDDFDGDGVGDACDPNAPPTLNAVTLAPAPAYRDTTLICSAQGSSDFDGDTVTIQYAWEINGSISPGETLPAFGGALAIGDAVVCIATPDDGTELGDPVRSNTVTIVNSLPTVASVTLTPMMADIFSTLTCQEMGLADADGDPVNASYNWLVNGGMIAATTSTLGAPDFAKADQVQCVVTPSDSTDNGASVTSNSVTIMNNAPTLGASTTLVASKNSSTTVANGLLDGEDSDNLPTELTYTLVTAPTAGDLQRNGTTLAANDTFTQDDVDNDLITYQHTDGTSTADSFEVALCDSDGGCISQGTATISVSFNVTYGNVTQVGACANALDFGFNYVLGSEPITLTTTRTLTDFNYHGCGDNVSFRMVLYRFQNGQPTTIIARSVLGNVGQGAGTLPVEGGSANLPAGTYLITAVYAQLSKGVAKTDPGQTTVWYQSANTTTQPSPMNGQTYSGQRLSYGITTF